MSNGVWLHALRSPLAPSDAVRRICELGPSVTTPVLHSSSMSVEVWLDDDPFAPTLRLLVEDRSEGSYVTARVVPSAFLRDFMRVIKTGFTVLVLAAASAMLFRPELSQLRDAATVLIGAWAISLALMTVGHDVLSGLNDLGNRSSRLRMRLNELLAG